MNEPFRCLCGHGEDLHQAPGSECSRKFCTCPTFRAEWQDGEQPPDKFDCDYTDQIVCPWCGHKYEPDMCEAGPPEEDNEEECPKCDRLYIWSYDVPSPVFSSKPWSDAHRDEALRHRKAKLAETVEQLRLHRMAEAKAGKETSWPTCPACGEDRRGVDVGFEDDPQIGDACKWECANGHLTTSAVSRGGVLSRFKNSEGGKDLERIR